MTRTADETADIERRKRKQGLLALCRRAEQLVPILDARPNAEHWQVAAEFEGIVMALRELGGAWGLGVTAGFEPMLVHLSQARRRAEQEGVR